MAIDLTLTEEYDDNIKGNIIPLSGSDAIIRELQWNVSLIKAESKLQPKELLSQANSVMIKELQRNTASLSMELAALMEKVEQMETRVDEPITTTMNRNRKCCY